MMHHRVMAAEFWEGGGGGHGPLQRGGIPRVHGGLLAVFHAPEQVDEEEDLDGGGSVSRLSHEVMHGEQFAEEVEISEVRIAPGITGAAQVMHGSEDGVNAQ